MSFQYSKLYICIFLFVLLVNNKISAQIDSTYIKSFDQNFSAKIYAVEKFAAFDKENEKDPSKEFTYRTNQPSSIGLGIAWKNYSLSFSKGFDFLRNSKRGKTKSLEFQHHGGIGRKLVYDVFLQQHSGFYESRQNEDRSYNIFPDVTLHMYGGTLKYVFNKKKFSYGAAFGQNERQLKSAGSFQLGLSLYYSKVKTDTTELFDKMKSVHENLQFGITGGYSYTWVLGRKWFLSGAVTIGANLGNNYPTRFFKEKMEVYPTINSQFAAGYNLDTWSIGLSSHFNRVYLFFDGNENLSMNNVSVQVTVLKRFHWGNKFVNETLNNTKKKLRL